MKKKHKSIIVCSVISIVLIVALYIGDLIQFADVSYLIFSLGVGLYASSKCEKLSGIMFLVFVLRILFAFFPDSDPDGYEVQALQYYKMNIGEAINNIPFSAYMYSWMISWIWRLLGKSILGIKFLNALISFLAITNVYEIIKKVSYNKSINTKSIKYLVLIPTLIMYSSHFASREPIIIFILSLYLKKLYAYYTNRKVYDLGVLCIYVLLLGVLHIAMILTIIPIVIYLFQNSKKNIVKRLFYMLCIGVFISGAIKSGVGSDKFNMGGTPFSLEKIYWMQKASAIGRAAYLENLASSNLIMMVVTLPIRMIFFIGAPFVWMLRNPKDVFGFIDTLIYIKLIYDIYKNRKIYLNNLKERDINYKYIRNIEIMTIAIIALLALVVSNYGAAMRHRIKIVLLLILLNNYYEINAKKENEK